MPESVQSNPDISALLALVSARFREWLLAELRPERHRQIRALKTRNLTCAGRAAGAFEIYRGSTERSACERIGLGAGAIPRGRSYIPTRDGRIVEPELA
jgi:hypothetical protein